MFALAHLIFFFFSLCCWLMRLWGGRFFLFPLPISLCRNLDSDEQTRSFFDPPGRTDGRAGSIGATPYACVPDLGEQTAPAKGRPTSVALREADP